MLNPSKIIFKSTILFTDRKRIRRWLLSFPVFPFSAGRGRRGIKAWTCPDAARQSLDSPDLARQGTGAHEAEADVVVPVGRRVVVTVGGTNVPRFVVPGAATDNTVRPASGLYPKSSLSLKR